MQATWNGTVIAESDKTIVIEGNHYFPPDSIRKEYFRQSGTHTFCAWKGHASYFHVVVDNKVNKDAAWFYPEPKDAAKEIKGHVAFWNGIEVKQ